VEYDPAEVDHFIAVADAVEDAFPWLIVDGVEVEGRPGAFQVSLEDGTAVFARAQGGAVPDPDDLVSQLSRMGVRPSSP
jgi:selT/selW/selH-like putative selenoprotein